MSKKRVAIVTGAGSGIGNAIARRLCAEGYRVLGADIVWPAENKEDEPGTIARVMCDVRKSADVRRLFQTCMASEGALDVVVNSAGVSGRWQLSQITDEEWNRVLDINLFGTLACTREAASIMCEQGSGRIINIASNRGLHGLKLGAPYAASKGAVIALTKSAALEFASNGVGVFALLPGATDTPLFRGTRTDEQVAELAKAGLNRPEHVADAVIPLLSPDALAFSGACIPVARQTSDERSLSMRQGK